MRIHSRISLCRLCYRNGPTRSNTGSRTTSAAPTSPGSKRVRVKWRGAATKWRCPTEGCRSLTTLPTTTATRPASLTKATPFIPVLRNIETPSTNMTPSRPRTQFHFPPRFIIFLLKNLTFLFRLLPSSSSSSRLTWRRSTSLKPMFLPPSPLTLSISRVFSIESLTRQSNLTHCPERWRPNRHIINISFIIINNIPLSTRIILPLRPFTQLLITRRLRPRRPRRRITRRRCSSTQHRSRISTRAPTEEGRKRRPRRRPRNPQNRRFILKKNRGENRRRLNYRNSLISNRSTIDLTARNRCLRIRRKRTIRRIRRSIDFLHFWPQRRRNDLETDPRLRLITLHRRPSPTLVNRMSNNNNNTNNRAFRSGRPIDPWLTLRLRPQRRQRPRRRP